MDMEENNGMQIPEQEEILADEVIAEEKQTVPEEKAAAPAESKGKKAALPLWATICIFVLSAAVVTLGVLFFIDRFNNPPDDPANNFISYTGVDSELIAIRDRVVATVGDKQLTNAQLQVYYYMYIYDFLDENGYYLSFIGLDYTKDLATQACYFDKTISWQQYFLDRCLDAWHQYAVLNIEAEKQGYQLEKEEQEYLDKLRETMDTQAVKYGYKDAQEMVEKELGIGVTFDAYAQYTRDSFVGMGFYNQYAEDIKITEEDIAAYYEENKETFTENKIEKDDTDFAWVGVRHILLIPEATKDENGKEVYTDDAWEACRKEAQALLDKFLGGKKVTEEVFADLAKKHTEDPGSKENGGLYEQFFEGEMVKEFETWSFDPARKYGDTGLVKTSYGYHIMYFIEGEAAWRYYSESQIRMDACQEMMDGLLEASPMTAEYQKMLLGRGKVG